MKVLMLKPEVMETLLYGCVTWRSSKADHDRLRKVHHQILLRCLSWRKRKREEHILSYPNTLLRTDSESAETTVRRQRIFFAGFVARTGQERLPRSVMRLPRGKGYSGGQKWDCMKDLKEDFKAFDI